MEKVLNLWKLSKQKLFLMRRQVIGAHLPPPQAMVTVGEEAKQKFLHRQRRSKFQVFLAFCCDCIHRIISNGPNVRGDKDVEDDCLNLTLLPFFGLETDTLKERFAKLLLGEDMSGCGKGVSSAHALSNALTNLAGTIIFNAPSFIFVFQL